MCKQKFGDTQGLKRKCGWVNRLNSALAKNCSALLNELRAAEMPNLDGNPSCPNRKGNVTKVAFDQSFLQKDNVFMDLQIQ